MSDDESWMVGQVSELLAEIERIAAPSVAAKAVSARQRLAEPLRVAVAGRLKAGKSTLINALAGDPIAATDATECTQCVTWYRYGKTEAAVAVTSAGDRHPLPYRRSGRTAVLETGQLTAATIDRLEVELPLEVLTRVTIIDTPGTASISEHLSSQSMDYLLDGDQLDAPDVVVYLMRHAHEQDLQFLEAYGQTVPTEADPLRALAVLSRADEIGSGRADSMAIASRLAAATRDDLGSMVANVLPVAGLLALAATTVTEADLDDLQALAALPARASDTLLRSARSAVRVDRSIPVGPDARSELLAKLGLFGLRTVIGLMAAGQIHDLDDLRHRLRETSGLEPVRDVVVGQYAERAEVLRAARAIGVIEGLLADEAVPDRDLEARVLTRLDAIKANAYELDELSHLRALRLEQRRWRDQDARDLVVRSLGGYGGQAHVRLLAAPQTPAAELAVLARRQLEDLDDVERTVRGDARRATVAAKASLRSLRDRLVQAS